ncbi:hypothetical protein VF07_37255 [Nostoc linckia z6]|nr:hypothetical protein VF07_37255 [Nostoc linckia z6]
MEVQFGQKIDGHEALCWVSGYLLVRHRGDEGDGEMGRWGGRGKGINLIFPFSPYPFPFPHILFAQCLIKNDKNLTC